MNRYTTMFRTHQPKMHYLFTLKDIYDEWANFHNPAYDTDIQTSLDLIATSHTEEDDYTIIPLFFYNAMTFAQYNTNNPLCAWSSNANDKTKVKKLFEEYILPKYWNKFYILDLIGKCDETPSTIRAMKQKGDEFISILNQTFPRYARILEIYDEQSQYLMNAVKQERELLHKYNDTPQTTGISDPFDSDSHLTDASKDVEKLSNDLMTKMARLDEIERLWKNVFVEWAREFDRLFITKGEYDYEEQ